MMPRMLHPLGMPPCKPTPLRLLMRLHQLRHLHQHQLLSLLRLQPLLGESLTLRRAGKQSRFKLATSPPRQRRLS